MDDITVLIADRDEARRGQYEGLIQNEPGISITGFVQTDRELLERAISAKPRIMLIAMDFSPDDLTALVRLVGEDSPRTHIILISHETDDKRILDALAAGSRGYLEVGEFSQFLTKSIRKVMEGEAWIPRKLVTPLLERLVWISRPSLAFSSPRTKVQ